jgi:hypothetical protein
MKDDNYVDKSSMKKQMNKALQQKNGDFFCWSGKTISHNGLKRPYYYACGKATGGWNQH